MPSGNVTEAIDNLTVAVTGFSVLFGLFVAIVVAVLLAAVAVHLTFTLFHSRSMMMGFPAAIFWALLGGYGYILAAILDWAEIIVWSGWWMLFAFACFGMTIFCMFAAYGLREKHDTYAEQELEGEDEGEFLGEEKEQSETEKLDDMFRTEAKEPKSSRRTEDLRERARKRREGEKGRR